MEPTVPTGEPVTYVAAGVVMLLVAGLFFQMSRRKREEH
jgi:LPXTG-motif cell wall-anchored protein